MSDYIPRQYAIAAIENQLGIKKEAEGENQSPLIEAYNAGYRTAMAQARLELMNIKSKTDWMPIEEKGLPQKNDVFLICDSLRNVYLAEFIKDVSADRQWWSIDFNQYVTNIIAWMPMPEAYRRKGVTING